MTLRKGRGKAQDPCCPPRKRPLHLPVPPPLVLCCPIDGVDTNFQRQFSAEFDSLAGFTELDVSGTGGSASVAGGVATVQNNAGGEVELQGDTPIINPSVDNWCMCFRASYTPSGSPGPSDRGLIGLMNVVSGTSACATRAGVGLAISPAGATGIFFFSGTGLCLITLTGPVVAPGFHDYRICKLPADSVALSVDGGAPVVIAGVFPNQTLPPGIFPNFTGGPGGAASTIDIDNFCADFVPGVA